MDRDRKIDVFADLIDGPEAAAILGISPENLRQRVRRRLIPESAMLRSGGLVAYYRSEIERLARDPEPSPSLLRSRAALRSRIERIMQDLAEIRDAIDKTRDVAGLRRRARRIVERAGRQLDDVK